MSAARVGLRPCQYFIFPHKSPEEDYFDEIITCTSRVWHYLDQLKGPNTDTLRALVEEAFQFLISDYGPRGVLKKSLVLSNTSTEQSSNILAGLIVTLRTECLSRKREENLRNYFLQIPDRQPLTFAQMEDL